MNDESLNNPIIEQYWHDEKMMILVFAQWCINWDLDPEVLYKRAYQQQLNNEALKEALDYTVSKEESDLIENETVLNVLQLFGNHDLAMVVQQEIDQRKHNQA